MAEDRTPADARNISTGHQPEGAAARPADTMDSDNIQAHRARDFDPAADVGEARPSGNPTDAVED